MKWRSRNWKYRDITWSAPSKNETSGFDEDTRKKKLIARPAIATTTKNHGPALHLESSTQFVVNNAAEYLGEMHHQFIMHLLWKHLAAYPALHCPHKTPFVNCKQWKMQFQKHVFKVLTRTIAANCTRRKPTKNSALWTWRWKSNSGRIISKRRWNRRLWMHCLLWGIGISVSWRKSLRTLGNVEQGSIRRAP